MAHAQSKFTISGIITDSATGETMIGATFAVKEQNGVGAACNIIYTQAGVSCSKDSFVLNQTIVFQIKFCVKSPALRVVAKR